MNDISTRSPFPYWTGLSTDDLIASAYEYEYALAAGRFAGDPDGRAHLSTVTADLRVEIARRQNEHRHGAVLHSHPRGQEPHEHEER